MTSVLMYWGSSDFPSVPEGLDVSHKPSVGWQVDGEVEGPGCGNWVCGERHADLTYLARFFLAPARMPSGGSLFISEPVVQFAGVLSAEAVGFGTFDSSSARVGLRVRQYIYSGGTRIGMKQKAKPRVIDCDYEQFSQNYTLPDTVRLPNFAWVLDRSKMLEIDVEVRFRIFVEGDASVAFWRRAGWGYPKEFTFEVPQFAIRTPTAGDYQDDVFDWELEPVPEGTYRR